MPWKQDTILKQAWKLSDFENDSYHLQVYGPNGFFRELTGTKDDALVTIVCAYETDALRKDLLTGNVILLVYKYGHTVCCA